MEGSILKFASPCGAQKLRMHGFGVVDLEIARSPISLDNRQPEPGRVEPHVAPAFAANWLWSSSAACLRGAHGVPTGCFS
jgi:hypothetical protein